MNSLKTEDVQFDLDTLLRFICTYSLNDTHVSQTIIAKSFDSFPEQVKSFAFLIEFSPEQKNFTGINITSIKSDLMDSSIKALSEFIDQFRKGRIEKNQYSLVYDFFSASPFSFVIYFFRNIITPSKNSPLNVNESLSDFFIWLIEHKSDQLFFTRILYFIRHWQTITIYDSENINGLKDILLFAKENKISPSFN